MFRGFAKATRCSAGREDKGHPMWWSWSGPVEGTGHSAFECRGRSWKIVQLNNLENLSRLRTNKRPERPRPAEAARNGGREWVEMCKKNDKNGV